MTEFDKFQRCKLVFVDSPEIAMSAVEDIGCLVAPDFDFDSIRDVFHDTIHLFAGRFPGYRSSLTKYHDLHHTLSVTLATVRLLHGCSLAGHTFAAQDVFLALLASLFHDAGLIQTQADTQGTGAKYTVGHEERSIDFTTTYLAEKGFTASDGDICAAMIRCTILALSPRDVRFPSAKSKILGHIVGSADLLAQMADRQYLEKLLLLYKEFQEARLPGFDSELDLLQKTVGFYRHIAHKRLYKDLGGVCDNMRSHFQKHCRLDTDIYAESIDKNLQYIEKLQKQCGDSYVCYLEHLKRGGISQAELKRYRSQPSESGNHLPRVEEST